MSIMTIVLAVLVLAFFGIAYGASKTWNLTHTLMTVFVFLMAVVFMCLAGMTLKTHQGWQKKYQTLSKDLESAQQQLKLLEIGDLTLPLGSDEGNKSVAALRAEVRRRLVDRGRVWRGVRPGGPGADNTFQLDLSFAGDSQCFRIGSEDDEDIEPIEDPAPDGEGGEAAPAAPAAAVAHGIDAGSVVFAFIETSIKNLNETQRKALFGDSQLPEQDVRGMCRVPVTYLGNLRVMAVNGNAINVAPVLPPSPNQLQAMQAKSSWVLYEIMPIDRHDVLQGLPEEQIASLFPADAADPRVIREYTRDMTNAEDADDPSRKRVRVKFLRDYEVLVDVDGDEPGFDRNFDPSGRAILSQLRQGEPTKFKQGDEPEIFFDFETANELRRDGVVEFSDKAAPRFVRPLRDYNYDFFQKSKQITSLAAELSVFQQDNASIAESADKVRTQIAYREDEISKLENDLKQFKAENGVLTKIQTELADKARQQRATLSSLYRWNNQQADEIRGLIFMDANSVR